MMCFVFFMLFEADIVRANDTVEEIKPLFDILLYCNTKEFIEKVATKDYNLSIAASGIVNDSKHKGIMDIRFLIVSGQLFLTFVISINHVYLEVMM